MAKLLVVDDDPVSRQFFAEVLTRAGNTVRCAGDGNTTFALATAETFDALLLDLHLPDDHGENVLRRLRDSVQAASRDAIAIATSAELTKTLRSDLLAAGFAEVLHKPVAADKLIALMVAIVPACAECLMVPASLTNNRTIEPPMLDDERALSITGDATIVAALRSLLAAELVSLEVELQTAIENANGTVVRDRLHRLRASCGFCGASALAAAGDRLRAWFDLSPVVRAQTWHHFTQTLRATRAALAMLD